MPNGDLALVIPVKQIPFTLETSAERTWQLAYAATLGSQWQRRLVTDGEN